MSHFAVWLVLGVAFCVANLPFINERLMALLPRSAPKSLGLRLLELLVFYLLAGGLGLILERQAGQIAAQNWEFYAITATMFLTFAFPGFVYRYLFRHSA